RSTGGTASEPRFRLEPRAVNHPRIAKGRGIHDRVIAGEEIRRQSSRAGSDPKAVSAETRGQEKTGNSIDRRDHRYCVWGDVDHPGPALRFLDVLETRVPRLKIPERAVE